MTSKSKLKQYSVRKKRGQQIWLAHNSYGEIDLIANSQGLRYVAEYILLNADMTIEIDEGFHSHLSPREDFEENSLELSIFNLDLLSPDSRNHFLLSETDRRSWSRKLSEKLASARGTSASETEMSRLKNNELLFRFDVVEKNADYPKQGNTIYRGLDRISMFYDSLTTCIYLRQFGLNILPMMSKYGDYFVSYEDAKQVKKELSKLFDCEILAYRKARKKHINANISAQNKQRFLGYDVCRNGNISEVLFYLFHNTETFSERRKNLDVLNEYGLFNTYKMADDFCNDLVKRFDYIDIKYLSIIEVYLLS
jgi:hypothetical protein